MIDILTVLLPHALMALAVWNLIHRQDLDDDPALPARKRPLIKRPTVPGPDNRA